MERKYDKVIIIAAVAAVFSAGILARSAFRPVPELAADNLRLDDQEATVRAIKKVAPAVVSIDVYQPQAATIVLGGGERPAEKAKEKVSSGTGFLISADGLIITNKHVVAVGDEKAAEYKVFLSTGKQYYAQLIGKDPLNDLAILKIFDKKLPFVEVGDSDKLVPGLTVVAIGNVLGVYQDSVTKGIVSGLNRNIVASDQAGNAENLGNVIQTDAEINFGNSGGPLIDLNGRVIGVNVAVDASGSSVGFAIPINDAKPVIASARESGRIIRPRLGIRFVTLTPELAAEKKLSRSSGAWVDAGASGQPAVLPGSPADKAGIRAGDIIIEANGIKLDKSSSLSAITQKMKPGNFLNLKIWRQGQVLAKTALLDEFSEK